MKTIFLRDGSTTDDIRLNRIIQFDERSRGFPIRTLVEDKKPRNYTWRCNQVLDQGSEGACVGFGITHELIAYPAEVSGLSNESARQLYFEAQQIDPWPGGAYPGASPFYEGTSVLAGIKVAQSQGYFDSYRWAFDITDVLLGLSWNGPAVFGTYWYKQMYTPSKCCGRIYPKGKIVGGHCYLGVGVNWDTELVTILNSWGENWGRCGRADISFRDLESLLKNDGEAAFFINRHE